MSENQLQNQTAVFLVLRANPLRHLIGPPLGMPELLLKRYDGFAWGASSPSILIEMFGGVQLHVLSHKRRLFCQFSDCPHFN